MRNNEDMDFDEAVGEALVHDITVYIRPVLSDWVKGEKPGYIYWRAQAEATKRGACSTWEGESYELQKAAVEAIEKALKATGHYPIPKGK